MGLDEHLLLRADDWTCPFHQYLLTVVAELSTRVALSQSVELAVAVRRRGQIDGPGTAATVGIAVGGCNLSESESQPPQALQ